jgi:tetratricopeptide (TPR) repeat protein
LDSNLNKIYLWAGRYDEALERAKRAAVSKPGFSSNYNLSQAYSFKGMHAEALSVVDKIMASLGAQEDQYLLDNQAQILARSGRREEALKILEKANALRAQNNIDSSYPMATIYAGLGDKDVAFKYLYETHEKHISMITFLMVDPCLHGLHDDPRFKDLLNKIGFE